MSVPSDLPTAPEPDESWPSMSMDRRYQDALFARMAHVYGWQPIRRFRDERIEWASNVLGYPVESFKSLDNDEAIVLLTEIRMDELAAAHDVESF